MKENMVRVVQHLFNFYNPADTIVVDGQFGPQTEAALNAWMTKLTPKRSQGTSLSEAPFEQAAVQAVIDVESPEGAFLEPNLPPILFEAHQFSKRTHRKYDESYPDISSPHGDRSLYKGGIAEYARLHKASKLDHVAALESTSWGKFQIMGFNHKRCGYDNVFDFVDAMKRSEEEQDRAFIRFIMSDTVLKEALRSKDWDTFARRYNGPGYKQNKYDTRIAKAYRLRTAGTPA